MKIFWRVLDSLEEYLAASLLIFTSLLVFVQVVLRYLFNYSLHWSGETAIYLIIWFIFIGSSIAVRKNAHVSVDAVVAYLPPLFKKIFAIIATLLCILFCVILIKAGWDMVSMVSRRGTIIPSIGIPMYIPYLAIPVGFTLMLIRFSQQLFSHVKSLWAEDSNLKEEK